MVGTVLLRNEVYISSYYWLITTRPLIAFSSCSREYFITDSRLLNFSTSCKRNVVSEGKIAESASPFRWSRMIPAFIDAGRLIRFAIVLSTCWSGERSEAADVEA